MCAVVAPLLSAGIGLAGAAVSAAGQKSAAESEAQAAEYNAKVEKINARARRQQGYSEQEKIGMKYDKLEGQGIAAAAKGGVDPGYGSAALTIFGENQFAKGSDQSAAYVNAESAATAHENKAKDYEHQASARRQAGKWGAASSFLSGLGGVVKAFGSVGGGGAGTAMSIGD